MKTNNQTVVFPSELIYTDPQKVEAYIQAKLNLQREEIEQKIILIPTEVPERESDEFDFGRLTMKEDVLQAIKELWT